jgi:small-conductance mechanosensitive channel
MNIQEFLATTMFELGSFKPTFGQLLAAVIVFSVFRFFIWFTNNLVLSRYFKRRGVDSGRAYAIRQVVLYIMYIVAIILSMQALGLSISVILAGSAALLVGVGLGLQQTFNDLVSGIILLVEGTVEVGDVVVLNNVVGTVTKIGIRTSMVETRDGISILVPNHQLVVEEVTNWSHNNKSTRFHVSVGVSYSSDVRKVEKLILQAAAEHPLVLKTPPPRVQFRNFGDYSLDFMLLFHSNEFLSIEFVKSDLRFRIVEIFREQGVEIPFPQRDVWLRSKVD